MANALSLLRKAESLVSRDHWSRAEPLLRQAARRPGDPFLRAEIFYRRGECLRALSRFREALACYREAQGLYRRVGLPAETARAVLGASACLRILGRYPEARRLWDGSEVRPYFQRPDLVADMEMERVLVARGQGRWAEARRRLASVRRVLFKMRDLPGLQHARWIEGGLERFSGRLRSAKQAFQEAVRLARRTRSPENIAYALCGLGGIQRVLGEGLASLNNYREASRLFRKSRDPFGQAYGLCGQANALRTFGDAQATLPLYRRSAALYRRLGDKSSEGFAHWGLGGSLRRLGRWRRSARAYGRAEALFKKSDDERGLSMVRLGKARLAESMGDRALALKIIGRSAPRDRATGLVYEAALARYEAGRIRRPASPPFSILRSSGISPAALRRWRDIP